jgi:hypothetical protein
MPESLPSQSTDFNEAGPQFHAHQYNSAGGHGCLNMFLLVDSYTGKNAVLLFMSESYLSHNAKRVRGGRVSR